MGLATLVLGLVVFLGAHVFVTLRAPRAAVINRIGEGPYKGLMSLVSLAGLILIGYGFGQYRATGWIDVDWNALEEQMTRTIQWLHGEAQGFKNVVTGFLPSAGAAGAGSFFGFRKK